MATDKHQWLSSCQVFWEGLTVSRAGLKDNPSWQKVSCTQFVLFSFARLHVVSSCIGSYQGQHWIKTGYQTETVVLCLPWNISKWKNNCFQTAILMPIQGLLSVSRLQINFWGIYSIFFKKSWHQVGIALVIPFEKQTHSPIITLTMKGACIVLLESYLNGQTVEMCRLTISSLFLHLTIFLQRNTNKNS